MFSEGHEQLSSLVKAGMSHMALLHTLIRRLLQLRVGLAAIKELSLLPSKPPFSRTSPAGAQRNYTSPPLDQIGMDKLYFVKEGDTLPRNLCVSLQVELRWLSTEKH